MKLAAIVCLATACAPSGMALAQLPESGYQGQFSTNPYAVPQYQPLMSPGYGVPPALYDQQGQFRGNLSSNPYDADSINNPYGRYGNPYSPDSVNNPYGAGNPYAPDSPTNPYGQGWSVYSQ